MKFPLLACLAWTLTASATSVVGHLSSPTGTLPALRVYAWSANGRLTAAATAPGQSTVRLDVPPGKYRLFATPADPGVPLVYVGHTPCSQSEEVGACSDHDLRWLTVSHDGPVSVEINDWHIEDAQADALDRALHQAHGAGDQDPSVGAPRFFEYPAASVMRTRATRLVGSDVRPELRARLSDALKSGHINFAGHAAVVELPCGTGCMAARILDMETGRVTAIPTGSEQHGLLTCPERLAYRRDSRLLRVGIEDHDGRHLESYYVWDPQSAALRPVGAPAAIHGSGCITARASVLR